MQASLMLSTTFLASYEGNLYSELERDKQDVKKCGRYNIHDSVVAPPHLRWPNEDFHSSSDKKRVIYDELSQPQWVAGQLSNIHSMSDPQLDTIVTKVMNIHSMSDPQYETIVTKVMNLKCSFK